MLTKPRVPSAGLKITPAVRRRHRGFSPLMLIGLGVTALVLLIGGGFFIVLPRLQSHAATATLNMDCTLQVPVNPLSAKGLATPYQLSATNAANGPCNEANANQTAFVQGVIYNPATGAFSVYSPVVVDQGTQPAVAPTAPTLPANAVVGLWFGFNGNNMTLQGTKANTLVNAHCVNGLNQSVFGQFSYCNAIAFFAAAKQGIAAGKVQVPALATAKDGLPCPTTRDFAIVDQDQSDNVQTQYIATGNGQIAQFSAANQAQLQNTTVLGNPSDNALLTAFVDPALGCQSWQAPNLADNNTPVSALPLDELQAAMDQKAPIALVPLGDPMTLVNNNPSLNKTNRYRRGSDQTPAQNAQQASTITYCQNLVNTGLPRILLDRPITVNATSPSAAMANSLFTFLAMRFMQTYTNLNCQNLINKPNPVTVQMDGNGVVISATITLPQGAGVGITGTGGVQQVAMGAAAITLDPNAGNAPVALNIVYPNHPNQQIFVNLVPNSCSGTPVFKQMEDTDGAGNNNANTVVNGLQGMQSLPANWFFTVTDPKQNNAVVACGSVLTNGIQGQTVLGLVVGTNAAANNGAAQGGMSSNTGGQTPPGTTTGGQKKKHQKW